VEALVFVNIAFQRRVGLFRRTVKKPTRRWRIRELSSCCNFSNISRF